ncbi:hypothetical protein ACFLQ2_04390 [archaeon]
MELTGTCDVCGKPCDLNTCTKCGKRVCKEHYADGLCSECGKTGAKGGGGEFTIPDSAKPTTVTPGDTRK